MFQDIHKRGWGACFTEDLSEFERDSRISYSEPPYVQESYKFMDCSINIVFAFVKLNSH